MTAPRGAGSRWIRRLPWVLSILGPIVWLALIAYSQVNETGFMRITEEDHLVENAQSLLFFVGAMLAGWIAWALGRRRRIGWVALYMLLAVGLGYLAGEEISWGQRIFQIETPGWFLAHHNNQDEMNLHNLPEVQHVTRKLFNRAVKTVTLLTLIGWMAGLRRRPRWQARLWVPHPALLPSWVAIWSYQWLRQLYKWRYQADSVSKVMARLHEAYELVLALAIVAGLLFVWEAVRQDDAPRAS